VSSLPQEQKKNEIEVIEEEKKNTKREKELCLPHLLTYSGTAMGKISMRRKMSR